MRGNLPRPIAVLRASGALYIKQKMYYNSERPYNSYYAGEWRNMHIMLTNDDGIFAPGLRELSKAAVAAGHRVTIFAPDSQRSAASHAISLTKPLKVERVPYDGIAAYSVNGTPADCAKLGLFLLRDDLPDIVISGVNRGSNRGAAIIYSGTVGAATEASISGVPAVAVSLCKSCNDGYECAARLGVRTAEWALKNPLPRGEIYNLNVPYGAKPLGVRAATVSNEYIFNPIYEETPEGYVMVTGENVLPETDENSDMELTHAGYATLSVIGWNRLAATKLNDFDELNEGI